MEHFVSKSQFKARALELLRGVEETGEPLIVTDRGEPRIEVRRFSGNNPSPLERLRGSVRLYVDPFDPVGGSDWESVDQC